MRTRRDPVVIGAVWACAALGAFSVAIILAGRGNILNVVVVVASLFVFFHYKDKILF